MKFLVPIHVANYVGSPGSVQSGYKKFYLKDGYFKLYDGANEKDLILDRPLDGFTPLAGTINSNDTVLTALEKLQNSISSATGSTLDNVLTNGNNSLLDANVGQLGIWDANVDNGDGTFGSYGRIYLDTDPAFPTLDTLYIRGGGLNTHVLFRSSAYGYASFKHGQYDAKFDFSATTDDRVWTLRDLDGTIAFLSDIPSLSGYATQAWTLSNFYPVSNPAGYITSSSLTGYVPTSRTLTINGVSYDLSADRSWTIATSSSPLTTKGDLYTFSTVNTRLPVGTDGQILTANSSVPEGLSWQDNYADWTSTVKHIVKNDGTSLITKGTPVYSTGSDGTNMLVGKASNTSEATSSKTMGLMQSDITTTGGTQTGFVITEGLLGGLNTAGTTAGDPVWLGPTGTLIYGLANKPYAPNHLVFIGIVTKVSAGNGEIFVKIQNGFELDELHNVRISGETNNDVLTYNGSTQVWENQSEEFKRRQKFNLISTDFNGNTTAAIFPFTFTAYNTGVHIIGANTNGTNPGTTRIVSSSTPNSGGVLSSNSLAAANIVPVVGQEMDYVFRTPTPIAGTGITIRAGFLTAANTITDAAFGIYMEIVDNQLYGKTANNNIRSTTSTAYTLPNGGVWYHMRVVYKAANLVEYTLYNMAGTILWTDTLTTNIPTSAYGCNLLGFSSASTVVNTELITNDYLAFTLPTSTRGALN